MSHHEHGHDHAHYQCCGTLFHGEAPFKEHRREEHEDPWRCACGEDGGSFEGLIEHVEAAHSG